MRAGAWGQTSVRWRLATAWQVAQTLLLSCHVPSPTAQQAQQMRTLDQLQHLTLTVQALRLHLAYTVPTLEPLPALRLTKRPHSRLQSPNSWLEAQVLENLEALHAPPAVLVLDQAPVQLVATHTKTARAMSKSLYGSPGLPARAAQHMQTPKNTQAPPTAPRLQAVGQAPRRQAAPRMRMATCRPMCGSPPGSPGLAAKVRLRVQTLA